MKRKRRRSTYVGCSLTSHRGRLRLEWRLVEPDVAGRWRYAKWSTGDPDTPANRARWEPVRKLIGALREQGEDPLPHLAKYTPAAQVVVPTIPESAPLATTGLTVRTWYGEWIGTKDEGAVRPALLRDYRRHFATYILGDEIAEVALADLRPLDIQLFQKRLRARWSSRTQKVLSEKTVHCVINGSLRAMIRDARVQDLIVRDPFVGLTWKKLKPPPADPFAPDEWDSIAAWFKGRSFQRKLMWRPHPAFYAFVFFLRWHGARPSEASALTWDHVDLRHGIAFIVASYHYGAVGEPKTEAANRSIELHPEMLTILRALRPLRPDPGAIVFLNLDGHRIRNATFWGTWTRCLQDCRIRHRGIYALKDTFVTHTLATAEESGEGERLTAWLVRQTGVRVDTLKRHYERWWPRDREAIRATYALLDPTVKGPNFPPRGGKFTQVRDYTANRKWTMSPSCTT
jgi:integrase